MAAKTDYLANALANHVLRNVAYPSPTSVYVALYTVAPTATTGGTEVSGGSYARQLLTSTVPSSGNTSNSTLLTWPQATALWGTVVAVGIVDALTAGNILYFGPLTTPKTVGTDDTFTLPISALSTAEELSPRG